MAKADKIRRAAAEAARKRDEGSKGKQGREGERLREEAARWERQKADRVREARQRAAEEKARVEREGAEKLVRDREVRERREREAREKTREVRGAVAEAAERRRMGRERTRREDEAKAMKDAKMKVGLKDPPSTAKYPAKPPATTQKQPAKPALKSALASASSRKPNITFVEPAKPKPTAKPAPPKLPKPEPEPEQPLNPREAVAAAARRREEAARKQRAEEERDAAKAAKTKPTTKPTAKPAPKTPAAASKHASSKSPPAPKPAHPKQGAVKEKPNPATKISAPPPKPAPGVSKTKPYKAPPAEPSNPRSAAWAAAAARMEVAAKQKREDEIKLIEEGTGKPTWDFGGLDGKGGVAYIAGGGGEGKVFTLNGSSSRETREKTGGWTIFGSGKGTENPPLDIPYYPGINRSLPPSYPLNPNPSMRAFTSPKGVLAALPKSLASSLRANPPASPEALLECLEDAAERGIPLSEPRARGSRMHREDGGELHKRRKKGRYLCEGVTERRAPIGIVSSPPHQERGDMEGGDDEDEDGTCPYTSFPRPKRRREVTDLGPLPPLPPLPLRPLEVDGRVNKERGEERKGKNERKRRERGLFGWFGS